MLKNQSKEKTLSFQGKLVEYFQMQPLQSPISIWKVLAHKINGGVGELLKSVMHN